MKDELAEASLRGASSFWPRPALRVGAIASVYAAIFVCSLMIALEFRDNFTIRDDSFRALQSSALWVLAAKMISMYAFGQFRGLLTFFRLPDVYRIAAAVGAPSLAFFAISFFTDFGLFVSRAAILLDFFFSVSLLCLLRTSLRIYRERNAGYGALTDAGSPTRVAIYGAGQTGAALAAHLMARKRAALLPVAFIDDDARKWNKNVHGIRVYRTIEDVLGNSRLRPVGKIIAAMPSASPAKMREIAEIATRRKVPVEVVPSWEDLVSGRKRIDKLRPVRIEDLLGRSLINLHSQKVFNNLTGKVVMVTGAGGTIGGELCKQIAQCEPSLLIMVERAEYLLFETEQKIRAEFPDVPSHAMIADITDEARMDFLMGGFLPNVIFHAAAHKHVPMMEHQPGEAIRNNTFGTAALADLALKHEVERFVFISTDKAVNPTNVMGVSKRLAEIFLQSLQETSRTTQFVAVRFGNVLGSSGSVIPTFKRQIEEGGPLTVTHPEITRYFMTVSEAVGLVLECSVDANGGEIFVLDMGEPVKIYDLAKQMVELSGLQVGDDIDIKFTGLRPGEKLYEELQHELETLELTANQKIFRFTGQRSSEPEVRKFLKELAPMLRTSDYNKLKRKIKSFVPEYKPDFSAPEWAPAHQVVSESYRKDGVVVSGDKIVSFKDQTA